MDDFLKGYSQGMTGSTNGLPSQSVMEAMGRDAARNQWNNTQQHKTAQGGASSSSDDDLIPVTKVLYEAGQKISVKKLVRHFGIAIALIVTSTIAGIILPHALEWIAIVVGMLGTALFFWTAVRAFLFGVVWLIDAAKGTKRNSSEAESS